MSGTNPRTPAGKQARQAKILLEAGKPRGVSFHELRDRLDIPTSVSRDFCRRLAEEGKLHCVRAVHGHGLRWFSRKDDAKAFGASQARPKLLRRNMDLPQPKKVQFAPTIDTRYVMSQDQAAIFVGEFGRMGIGVYL